MGQEISNLTACCEPETTLAATPEIQMKKVNKAAFKTEDKAEVQSTKRMSRSKLIMERQAAGFKTLQSYSTSPSSSEQAPILVSPRKLAAASSNSFTSNLMSPMKRKAQSGGGGGSPPTSSRSMWSPREVNGVANQRSVSPEKGARGVHEQGGGDENGVEVTRKLRVMNGLVYDVESGVIIGEDEAAKLAPFAAAEAKKQDDGEGSEGHGGGAGGGGGGGAGRESAVVDGGSRKHLEHPIFSSALRISSSGPKSQGPNSGGLSLPLHLVHREVSNEPRATEKASSNIESAEAAVLLKRPGSQERGIDASPRQSIVSPRQSIAQEIVSPGRMASPRVLAHKVSKSQLASS